MILTEYSSSLYSKALVCFLLFFYSTFDVGRSILTVRLGVFDVLFFSDPSTVFRRQNLIRLCFGNGFLCVVCIYGR
jgi:hypothetical protein